MIAIKDIDSGHVLATSDSLLMCLWRTVTPLAAIARLRKIAFDLVEASPGPILMLTVVEAEAEMPSSEVRSELSRLFRELATTVSASSLIFEGDGFRAATVRAIATGMSLVARQPFPHRVFGRVDDAAAWMTGFTPPGRTAGSIAKDFADVRAALDAQARPQAHPPM